jgi:transcriptional regulator NrdR family protein
MICPTCLEDTALVLETRQPSHATSRAATCRPKVATLAQDFPDMVYRRRRCRGCGHVTHTIEVPLEDFDVALNMVPDQ